MIRLRLASTGDDKGDLELQITSGETLEAAVTRVLENVPLDRPVEEVFHVLVNGHIIEKDLWAFTELKESDSVLVAPKLKGGRDFNRAVLAIVLVAAGAAFLTPALIPAGLSAAGTAFATGLINAAIGLAAFYISAQLIPFKNADFGAGLGGGIEGSQMYTLGSQSNQVLRLGPVPKVYGQHRMFPNIAANPYTELEVDPATGELVQYFYAVYDFGLGPYLVSDLRIGDTPIGNFNEVQYNFVDFNKPAVDEGEWDEALINSLQLYKGDVTTEQIGVALNGNQEAGSPVSEWEVIRDAQPNTNGVPQEITLGFVNPSGLFGFGSDGSRTPRTIDLEIEFSRVGEDVWRPWNDLNFVSDFKSAGGSEQIDIGANVTLITPPNLASISIGGYSKIGTRSRIVESSGRGSTRQVGWRQDIGYTKGQKVFIFPSGLISVGTFLYINGQLLTVIKTVNLGGGRTQVETSQGLNAAFPLGQFTYRTGGAPPADNLFTVLSWDATNKVRYGVPAFKRARITRLDTSPVYSTFKFTPRTNDSIKVRVRRIRTFSAATFQTQDDLAFSQLQTRFDSAPILTTKRHVYLEVRIKATNQLNGAIQNLSAICTSVLDTWDGTQWVKQPTSNPAWVFADLLTGEINKRAVSKSRLHLPSLLEWEAYCDEVPANPPIPDVEYFSPRFQANFIVDYTITLQELLAKLTALAQASLNIIDGQYGVLVDKRKTTPVQVFTPRNSRGFNSSRAYAERPNAINVTYIDPAANWELRSVKVFDQGFDETNYQTEEEIQTFGVTNQEQAYRYGRYLMAQSRLRQETIQITTDFEHLVCTRGDYVLITQDVMKVGGTPARVKSVTGNRVVLDDALEIAPISYAFVFRSVVHGIVQNSATVVAPDTFDLGGSVFPQKGDLIIIGEAGSVVFECIVKSIEPNADMTATLTLVERADAIFDAESSAIIPEYEAQLNQTFSPDLTAPPEVANLIVTDNTWECNGAGYRYFVELDWESPPNGAAEAYEIYVDFGRGFDLADVTRETEYRFIVDERRLGLPHSFKVLAVSATGNKLNLGEVGLVTATPLPKTTRPSNVESLSIDITNEVLQLVWPKVEECDIAEYLIRYSPEPNDIWESSIPLLRVNANVTLAATQARTGVYLIKAVDFNGNESTQAARAVTTIPNLFNLNVIEEITDFPALTGVRDRVVTEPGQIRLLETIVGGPTDVEYEPEGYYYYNDLLDLGDIYTVRLQSLIRAEGFTLSDLMSNWTLLSDIPTLTFAGFSDWNVESEYRTTSELNVISNWNPMSDVDPISVNDRDIWSEWRKFIVGDATGRIFQFRLKLISNRANVTPRVFDGTIKADMPDRTASFENQVVPPAGLELLYSPGFYGPGTTPNVQVSIEDAESGDYWVFDYKTLDGLKITVFDRNDVAVTRTVDIQAKGYGRRNATII